MRFHVYKDTAGYSRWRLLAANNRTIADSGEGYNNKQDCLSAVVGQFQKHIVERVQET